MKSNVITPLSAIDAKRILAATEAYLRDQAVGSPPSGDELVANVLKEARKDKSTELVMPFVTLYVTLLDACSSQRTKPSKRSPRIILIA